MAKKSDGTRELIISSYRDIERELQGNQEVLWTFFFPTREMEMFVGRFGKTAEGLLRFEGETTDDRPVVLVINESQLSYLLSIKDITHPRKIGFTTD